jgi:inner membrane protease subunit 1
MNGANRILMHGGILLSRPSHKSLRSPSLFQLPTQRPILTIRYASNGRIIPRKPLTLWEKRALKLRERKEAKRTKEAPKETFKKAPLEETAAESAPPSVNRLKELLRDVFVPVRYRKTGKEYTREEARAIAKSFPIWLILVGLATWDKTAPFGIISIRRPSMLPTMAPDTSDIWLMSTWCGWRKIIFKKPYSIGDLVGFAHPESSGHTSCKRIIGLPGDRVKRYGEYVHLYYNQDPERWGIIWPDTSNDPVHGWLDPENFWDTGHFLSNRKEESERTIIVPENHVWVESDCPVFGIDSRHFGPIPIDWIKGKIVGRLWPLSTQDDKNFSHKIRPHPIPLDTATLKKHNVHVLDVRRADDSVQPNV